MSDDQQINVPASCSDVSTEQLLKKKAATCPVPPVEDGAACSAPPPNDETETSEDFVLDSKPDNDDASPAPSPNHAVSSAPSSDRAVSPAPSSDRAVSPAPSSDRAVSPAPSSKRAVSPAPSSKRAVSPAPSSKRAVSPAPSSKRAVSSAPSSSNHDAYRLPRTNPLLFSNKAIKFVPKAEPGLPNVKSEFPMAESGLSKDKDVATSSHHNDSYDVKPIIKQEIIDLGNDTYYYDSTNKSLVVQEQKVGFDRGLEPDHIVGATERNGKLMFLIAWKNSDVADLLESTVVYKKCPQIAIQFFEKRLTYKGPNE